LKVRAVFLQDVAKRAAFIVFHDAPGAEQIGASLNGWRQF
jgi:hypothetical protein